MPTLDELMKVIAENLPSPHALDDVWRQTADGAVFDLGAANPDSVEEWHALASCVAALWPPVVFEHIADSGTTYRCTVNGPAHVIVEKVE